jgi:hypothetical protein
MPTIVQKENRCTSEASGAAVRAIFIARHKRNAEAAYKRNYVPQAHIGDYLFTGMSQRDKYLAHWLRHLIISVREKRATKSKLCSRS